jgi:hypothetical protein
VDTILPKCQYLQPDPKFTALVKPWRPALALPADAAPFLREVLKFLGTLALIIASGLIMLMAG